MAKLKAGIIGLGVGEKHIEGYKQHPECEVVALCDFAEEKMLAAQTKYPEMMVTRDPEDILKDPIIDVVSIASFDNYHYEQIVYALNHGKHLFVEKPIVLFAEELRQIRSLLSQQPRLQISSNLILRMSPRFKLLKQMITSGDFGQLFLVEGDYNYGRLHKITQDWRGRIDYYSVILGGGVHIIDLLLWLTGDEVVEVMAYGNKICSRDTEFRYDDLTLCLLKFKSGLVGKVAANFGCVYPHFHKLSIYGTRASFENGPKHGLLFESRDPSVEPKRIEAAYPGAHKGDLIYSFVDAIVNGTQPVVTTEDVFKTMSVCFAIEESAQTGYPIQVTYI